MNSTRPPGPPAAPVTPGEAAVAGGIPGLLDFTLALAAEAGALALRSQPHLTVTYKSDRSVVTNADVAVQALIRDAVASAWPGHGFVGEESDEGPSTPEASSDILWIVDPIDGTDPYRRGLPAWAVSIGVLRGKEPLLGVLALPATGEVYGAEAGGPARLNGDPIRVDPSPDVGRTSLLLVPSNLHQVARPTTPGRIQAYGSTCVHLAYVARGSAHAAILGGSSVWDYFAASVILEAAGGALFSLTGERLELGKLARQRASLRGALACHPAAVAGVFDAFDVDLPRGVHGFTGAVRRGTF